MVFVNSHPLQGFEGYWECSLQSCLRCTRSNPNLYYSNSLDECMGRLQRRRLKVMAQERMEQASANAAKLQVSSCCLKPNGVSYFFLPKPYFVLVANMMYWYSIYTILLNSLHVLQTIRTLV